MRPMQVLPLLSKMPQITDFLDIIEYLDENGLLEHMTLIGGWAEIMYEMAHILPGLPAMPHFMDIAFLLRDPGALPKGVNIHDICKQKHCTITSHYLAGYSSVNMRMMSTVRFLVSADDAGGADFMGTGFGVSAFSSPWLRIVKDHTLNASWYGVNFPIAEPESHILYRIMSSGRNHLCVRRMLPYVDRDKLFERISELNMDERSKLGPILL